MILDQDSRIDISKRSMFLLYKKHFRMFLQLMDQALLIYQSRFSKTILIIFLLWVFTELFNDCIKTGELPCDFKTALVTPLYKKKGNKEDVNNCRGISVIPPAAKAFEKILADQINEHLSNNNILFNSVLESIGRVNKHFMKFSQG